MKQTELRTGNWIEKDGKQYQISALGIFCVGPKHKPIQLTEEWLVKFGFNEIKYNGCDIWKLKDQSTGKHISFVFYNEELYTSFDTEPAFEPIQYVHQLQNLYFALTGEELTIK